MNNIDIRMSTNIDYKNEKPPTHEVRFSANFKDEIIALAFQMDLLQCISKFQVDVSKLENKK
jgi:hypothetical protein